jgi:hypothetical protein
MKIARVIQWAAIAAVMLMANCCQASSSFTVELIANSDFALFAGDETSVSRVLYQNDVMLQSQTSVFALDDFCLQTGETTFYLLAMTSGGTGNIGGSINGVYITSIQSGVEQSSDLSSYLTDYSVSLDLVETGSYVVQLADVQLALAGASWSSPTLSNIGDDGAAYYTNGNGEYTYDGQMAVLFKFSATLANLEVVQAVPEPATTGLLAAGALFSAFWRGFRPRV